MMLIELSRPHCVFKTRHRLMRTFCNTSSTPSQPFKLTVRQVFDEHRYRDYSFLANKAVPTEASYSITDITKGTIGHFLPRGYPHSVAINYGTFAMGQLTSSVLGTACGVLSMQSMLFAMGAGSGSLPLAATLNWIIKDGVGQFGGILFASMINNRFDADPKRWRMISGISLDLASFIELMTPLAPAYFLPMACVANVGKNIAYLSASASRAAIHKSFAKHENLADVTAKSGSQSIVGSLVGTSLGLSIAATVGQNYPYTLSAFVVCSLLSLTATYRSLQAVTVTTMSIDRLEALLADYLQQRAASTGPNLSILTPAQLLAKEYLLGTAPSGLLPVQIGAPLHEAVRSAEHMTTISALYAQEEYLLTSYSASPGQAEVYLLYKENASLPGMLAGLMHSYVLRCKLHDLGMGATPDKRWPWRKLSRDQSVPCVFHGDLLAQSLEELRRMGLAKDFAGLLLSEQEASRWCVDALMLEPRRARVRM